MVQVIVVVVEGGRTGEKAVLARDIKFVVFLFLLLWLVLFLFLSYPLADGDGFSGEDASGHSFE